MDLFGIVDPPAWICLAFLGLVLFLIYGSYPMFLWKRLQIPGPSSLPFIGNVHQFIDPKTGVRANISRWQKQYGKIIGVHYFRKPCLVVTDIDILKDMFIKEYSTYHDRFFVADGVFFPEILCKGVFFQRGLDWKRIRRIMTTAFTSGKLKTLTFHINKSARQLADTLVNQAEAGNEPKAKDMFGAYSLDVIAGTAFSLEINSQNNMSPKFFEMVQSLFKPTTCAKIATAFAGVFPFLGYVFKQMNISIFDPKAVKYISEYIAHLISERKNCIEESKYRDTIQYLIDSEMDESADIVGEKRLTKEEVISQGITFLLAGYETTSSTLQFVAYLLAKNKHVQDKLLHEILTVVGEEGEVTYDLCQKLTYMEGVINETLRLYPPVHLLKRETSKPTNLSGYSVPARTGIFIPVYNIGRDANVFENPDSFNPDRFTNGNHSSNAISFLPFGFGPKQCIGMRLALMELKIALVHVLRKVKFQRVSPEVLEFEDFTGILLPKKPIALSLKVVNGTNCNNVT